MIFRWVTMTPLGWPVEPEVYCNNAISEGMGAMGGGGGGEAGRIGLFGGEPG